MKSSSSQGAEEGLKRCEEIMGPFTLFRVTWGLPKPVTGMSLSSCPERLPSLSFSHISTPAARHYRPRIRFSGESVGSLMSERGKATRVNDRSEGGQNGMRAVAGVR